MIATLNLVCLAAAIAAAPSSSTRADLSGTWAPDLNAHQRTREAKTPEAAKLPVPSSAGGILFLPPLRIVDSGSTLTFDSMSEDSKVLSTSRLTANGKDETAPAGGGTLTRTSRSTREGRSVKTEWRQTNADGTASSSGTETWTLSNDGNTLTHTTISEDASWRNRTKTMYRRK